MLSSVLRSREAIAINIEIMRAFVRLNVRASGRETVRAKKNLLDFRFHDLTISRPLNLPTHRSCSACLARNALTPRTNPVGLSSVTW